LLNAVWQIKLSAKVLGMLDPKKFTLIKESFQLNKSVTQVLIENGFAIDFSTLELIYDLQAGSYTRFAYSNEAHINSFTDEIIQVLKNFVSKTDTILDCGTGEGTTLKLIVNKLEFEKILALDASWSRLSFAIQNTQPSNIKYAVGDIANIPLKSNSIEVVLTVHALEPNGGRELQLLREMARVSSKLLVLVEPDFDNSSSDQKVRMKSLNYINSLDKYFQIAGLKCIYKNKISNNINPLNVAYIYVLKKLDFTESGLTSEWVCPVNMDELSYFGSGLLSLNGLFYPSLGTIPFLRRQDAKFVTNPNPGLVL